MDITNSLYGEIANIVRKETQWLRHYVGTVLNNIDPLKEGRLLIEIPELEWIGPEAVWASPRFLHEVKIPKIKEPVEIYFINMDMNRPVWLGLAGELKKGFSKNHTGVPTQAFIYENPTTGHSIKYDELLGKITIESLLIEFGKDAVEPAVLGTALVTYLTTLVGLINTALGTKLDGSGTIGGLTPPTTILSTGTKIK